MENWQANSISHQIISWAGEIEEWREVTNTSTHTHRAPGIPHWKVLLLICYFPT